ncbi:MAG TPA: hypothetical protein VFP41_05880 [Actinomycetota bacterium]|nr:hypothetical protein [Actinomycetota bacterium]
MDHVKAQVVKLAGLHDEMDGFSHLHGEWQGEQRRALWLRVRTTNRVSG